MAPEQRPTMMTIREYAEMQGLQLTDEQLATLDTEMQAWCLQHGIPRGKCFPTAAHHAGYVWALQDLATFVLALHQEHDRTPGGMMPDALLARLLRYVTTGLEGLGAIASEGWHAPADEDDA
jgi:hypothetical protein